MANRALIITPTGCPIMEHEDYDSGKHWRMTLPERTYDTCVVAFREDFEPEPNSYDMVIRKKGYKYKLIPQIADMMSQMMVGGMVVAGGFSVVKILYYWFGRRTMNNLSFTQSSE